jgi:hypothetical protein
MQRPEGEEKLVMMSWKTCSKHLSVALLLAAATQASAADTTLSTHVSPNPAVVGSTVELDVMISDAVDLYAYQFWFAFNPAVLQATSTSFGSYLNGGGYGDGGAIDNTLGAINYSYGTLVGAQTGVSGAGQLAHFTFKVIGTGSSKLDIFGEYFLDSKFEQMSVVSQNQTLLAVPEPEAYLMLGLGLVGLAALRRRQLKQPAA